MGEIRRNIQKRVKDMSFTTQIRCIMMYSTQKMPTARQRHEEEKRMFGGILETKREKKARERIQKKKGEPIRSIGAEAQNSELYWLSRLSPKTVKPFTRKLLVQKQTAKEVEPSSDPITMQEILVTNIHTVPLLAEKLGYNDMSFGDKLLYPAVTRILGATMPESSKKALERWKEKMIASLGPEGFHNYNTEQLKFGAKFHETVKGFLEKGDHEVPADMEAIWASIKPTLKSISNVQFVEESVFHPKLKYKGVVDCVAAYKRTNCVIEWKVSEKQKPFLSSTYDAPLQLCAYLGALSYNPGPNQVSNGLVVVCYKDGSPAHVFPMDTQSCRQHWKLWLMRLQTYWMQSNIL